MPGAYERYSVSSLPPQEGRVVLITGSNDGIGYETAKPLALRGARVYMACRSQEKAERAIERMKAAAKEEAAGAGAGAGASGSGGAKELDVHFLKLDLANLQAVREAAEKFKGLETKLDLLVGNAGVMACPYALTEDGIETQFQTNYLSHWLLFKELQPLLAQGARQRKDGQPSRVVFLTSTAHQFMATPVIGTTPDFTSLDKVNRGMGLWTWGAFQRYSQAKLCALYCAREINKLYPAKEIRAAAVHPGIIDTDLYKNIPIGQSQIRKRLAPVPDGALASLYVGCSDEVVKEDAWDIYRGTYGLPEKEVKYKGEEKLRSDLWALSEKLCQEKAKM